MKIKTIAAGGLAGFAATVPMTVIMLLAYRLLPREEQYTLPQGEIIESLTGTVGTHEDPESAPEPSPTPEARKPLSALALLAHFGYGAASGVAYAALLQRRCRAPIPCGLVFGLLLWAIGYLGWLPAAGILTPATQHPRGRTAMMIAAHLVYGPMTALLLRRWSDG